MLGLRDYSNIQSILMQKLVDSNDEIESYELAILISKLAGTIRKIELDKEQKEK